MEPGAAPSPPSLVSDVKAAYARSRVFQVVVLLGGAVIAGSAGVRLLGDHLFLALFMSTISVVSFVMVGQLLFTGLDPDDDDDDDEDDDF